MPRSLKKGPYIDEKLLVRIEQLNTTGEKRVIKEALESITSTSIFQSALEKKFAETLKEFVLKYKGTWSETIIKGGKGIPKTPTFTFSKFSSTNFYFTSYFTSTFF